MTDERKYKLGETFEPQGDDEGCSSCGTQQATLKVFQWPPFHRITQKICGYSDPDRLYTIEEILTFCDFCATTFCSHGVSYPDQTDQDGMRHTMEAIALSHNAIMAELRAVRSLVNTHGLRVQVGLQEVCATVLKVQSEDNALGDT